jgi:hypothetical protein
MLPADPETITEDVKTLMQITTEAAKQALETAPEMSEVSVQYGGIKVTLKRAKDG